ncbi:MAG: outer membrane lipoprotein-sorting protein [Candidatus Eisenbacteria bacterium]|uniref:Outer membrane lipoprotein-sorting protein n=1 Tax=Eiseniibacteriota bacterium TaxID=2212470 RepID=A0A538TX46_UNCEI|nr:MAG: outer membrane lipoprotein-sorting protein [Candidatus Eisenbacteria bacterium]
MPLIALLLAAALAAPAPDTLGAPGARAPDTTANAPRHTAPPAAAAPSAGPTLAVEDTMRTAVPEVLVRAPRVTLDEILDRVVVGELRRDQALHDVAFTATLRVVGRADNKAKAKLLEETVYRVYKQKPGRARTVTLRHWEEKPSAPDDDGPNFGPNTAEDIVNFAFQPEARRDFRYRILGRDLLGDHLIYRIAFEPRSLMGAMLPGGLVWVDTRDFVIVRQELDFARSPFPLLIKGVDRVVIERERVEGHWMLHRILVRAGMTVPLPKYGHAVDFAMRYDDYAVNRGLPDSLFTQGVRK